jgi:hypothetical protein
MTLNEKLYQHRFTLNNGGGEIPALGFGTSANGRGSIPLAPQHFSRLRRFPALTL